MATARTAALRRLGRRPARRAPRDSSTSWPLADRACLALCWGAGITLCAIAAGILIYMLVRGLQYISPEVIFSHPQANVDQSGSGGFLDPLYGTLILTTLGVLIAVPIGVATAVWLTEYGRPFGLARAVESAVEIVAGTPSIVLAIFGLLVFTNNIFTFLSFRAEGGAVFGRSFLIAGLMMALIALPYVVGATREALQAIPSHVREASYALGKTKAATIRRVLLPASRPGVATGTALGMGHIAGDTAIVVLLLGATLQLQGVGSTPVLGLLRGTGSTLTSFVYNNSPAGEGNAPQKAYAAAFVLLVLVLALNWIVGRLGRRGSEVAWTR